MIVCELLIKMKGNEKVQIVLELEPGLVTVAENV